MKKLIAMLMTAALLTGLFSACGNTQTGSGVASETAAAQTVEPTQEAAPTQTAAQESAQEAASLEEPASLMEEEAYEGIDITVGTLKGSTGAGMAKLMEETEAGTAANNYQFTLSADPSEVVTKVIAGEFDIACLPTNSAAVVYQKTQGKVQLLALNTEGVLHILQNTANGEAVTDWAQLKGKTIYTIGQGANPEYVLDYVLRGHGIDPDTDVTIQFCAAADEVIAACASGEAEFCMLPEPNVSVLTGKVEGFASVLDLTDAWNEIVEDGSILTQGCVVVQSSFAQEHPQAVKKFLEEYEASIRFVTEDQEGAAKLLAQYEIVPSEAIALKALPGCHIIFQAGEEMKKSIQGYYQVLFDADPTSIGGQLPDDGFYYISD